MNEARGAAGRALIGIPPPIGRRSAPALDIVARADIPGGGQLVLRRRGSEFSIQFGADELMGNVAFVSEQALATLTRARAARGDGHILIGGLGMGFTLRAALSAWGPSARITVAELVPDVLAWAHGPLAGIFGESLGDPRLSIELADVHDVIDGSDGRFDAILLDVDNGPDGFMRPENDRLYCGWGLRSAFAALAPGGVLAVWSAYPDRYFAADLAAEGFRVEEVEVPAFAGSTKKRHRIWFGIRPG